MIVNFDLIIGKVRDIMEEYAESDPERLCWDLDIILEYEPMGATKQACKDFFIRRLGISVITVNSELTDTFRRIITAHELGHAVLHTDIGERGFLDVGYFNEADDCEKEANFFAAELLLTDNDVLDAFPQCQTITEAASLLYVPVELLDLKLQLMEHKGYDLHAPKTARPDFMRNMDVQYGEGF